MGIWQGILEPLLREGQDRRKQVDVYRGDLVVVVEDKRVPPEHDGPGQRSVGVHEEDSEEQR